jgi:hypothetical protein
LACASIPQIISRQPMLALMRFNSRVALVRLQAGEPLILDPAGGPLAARTLTVSGRRHVQDLTDRLDAELVAIRVDERAHLGRSASSSVAKNTEAAFKISFARRSS